MIYLDHNATTPLLPAVRDAMLPWLDGPIGNASSAHQLGRRSRSAVEDARAAVAEIIQARSSEIIFTSGGTEANNLALFGVVDLARHPHILASPIEHSSVIAPLQALMRAGTDVEWLAVDAWGRIDPEKVAARLRPDTALVTVGWANNEIGTLQEVPAIAQICRARAIPFHVDAVQALGKIEIDVNGIDLCSLSAHKIGGPQGVGALYVRRGASVHPALHGGSQERGLRPGTENVAGIVGFGAAARASRPRTADLTALRERLWQGLRDHEHIRRNSSTENCLPNTLHVSVRGTNAEAVVAALDLEGVGVSAGAACSAGAAEPSHVMRALGRSADEAREGVRFSLGRETTGDDIDVTVSAVARVLERLGLARAAAG